VRGKFFRSKAGKGLAIVFTIITADMRGLALMPHNLIPEILPSGFHFGRNSGSALRPE
jgi:hypothetical protein